MSQIEGKLQELLQFAKRHDLAEMLWKDGDVKIAFRRGDSPVAAPAPSVEASENGAAAEPVGDDLQFVRSPMVGTFRRSVTKGRPPLIMIGNHIKPGDPLGVVECMKIPTDVTSYCGGEIKEILVEDGQAVEFGQPLFSIIPGTNGNSNGNGHV